MEAGDRVNWTYEHHLNRYSSVYITKEGTLIKFTGETKSVRYVSGKFALVHFDGNKHPSKVLVSELKKI